jgi:hypothetical protein
MAASGSFKHDVGERAPDISGKLYIFSLGHALSLARPLGPSSPRKPGPPE